MPEVIGQTRRSRHGESIQSQTDRHEPRIYHRPARKSGAGTAKQPGDTAGAAGAPESAAERAAMLCMVQIPHTMPERLQSHGNSHKAQGRNSRRESVTIPPAKPEPEQ